MSVIRSYGAAGLATLAIVVAAMGSPARAETSSCDCTALTAWTSDSGLPSGSVFAITQDVDGFLWLGTNGGLVRFDGFQFARWGARAADPLLDQPVFSLIASRSGGLWVGFNQTGGVARVVGDKVTHHPAGAGLVGGAVSALLEDRGGTLWVAAREGVSVFKAGTWRQLGPADGVPDGEIVSVFEDLDGGYWLGTGVGVFHRPAGSARFELHSPEHRFVRSFAQVGSGTIWITDSDEILRRLGEDRLPALAPEIRLPAAGWRLLHDRQGRLWIAAVGWGLLRVDEEAQEPDGRAVIHRVNYEHAFRAGGLGGPRSLFQDRDDNIWVGMRGGGLLRITQTAVQSDTELDGITGDGVRALTASPAGDVWVATGHSLNRFADGGRQVFDVGQTMALHADAAGTVWIATGRTVGRFVDGRLVPLPVPDAIRLERIAALTSDPTGALWICSNDQGLFRWHHGVLDDFAESAALAQQPCSYVHADRAGRVWVGLSAGGVGMFENGEFRIYGEGHNLAAGRIVAIHEDAGGSLWVASVEGLSRFDDGTFTTLTADHGLPDGIVPSLIDDEHGDIWLGVRDGAGAIRFDAGEMGLVARDPSHQLRYTLYDRTDGFLGDLLRGSRPAAVRGGDGRLWFVSGNGMAVVDPAVATVARDAPVPQVTHVAVNGTDVPLGGTPVFASGTRRVEIEYSALDLLSASKLRFRYMLDGFSDEWTDAGDQRVASFANLAPGRYEFRVRAAVAGSGADPEAVWAFSVRPPFYQMAWFYVVCVTAVGLLLSGAWWMRVRAMRHEFALVVAERARVSRDIHDTLLQNLTGVGLELEVLASQLDTSLQGTPSAALRGLRRRVGRCIVEARRSILELRATPHCRDLISGLRDFVEEVGIGQEAAIGVDVTGAVRRLPADVEEQFLRIAQEAAHNAIRHAGARTIRIALAYRATGASLRVSDDGCGFVQVNGEEPDGEHWGLRNMQERAARISARLTLTSSPGRGTTVDVDVTLDA